MTKGSFAFVAFGSFVVGASNASYLRVASLWTGSPQDSFRIVPPEGHRAV